MRILVDANIFVSYLLDPLGGSTSGRIVATMISGYPEMDFLVSETSILEVREAINRKPYLSNRIPLTMVEQFVTSLDRAIQIVPALPEPVPSISRDHNDDYLWGTALRYSVDIIISGDKDLLVLDPIGGIRVLSPAVFLAFIDASAT